MQEKLMELYQKTSKENSSFLVELELCKSAEEAQKVFQKYGIPADLDELLDLRKELLKKILTPEKHDEEIPLDELEQVSGGISQMRPSRGQSMVPCLQVDLKTQKVIGRIDMEWSVLHTRPAASKIHESVALSAAAKYDPNLGIANLLVVEGSVGICLVILGAVLAAW